MKILTPFKTVLFYTAFIAATFIFITSCSNNSKPVDTKEVAEDHNEAKFDDSKNKEKDAQFLVDAAEINLEEIQLGQLAQKNSKMVEVKELGKMMEVAHTKSWNDLTELAQQKQISIPTMLTDDAKDANEKLTKKTGKDFDKEYCDMMVNGHKDAIDKFEKASNDASDPEIKAWAVAMLPELRKHLDHSMMCQKKCEKM